MRWPTATATLTTAPGIGAATCQGLVASATGRAPAAAAPSRTTRTVRGWPFSSKHLVRGLAVGA